LDELQDIAVDIRRAVRDMDACVRNAYNDVQSIRDSGRGLNEVRQHIADVLRKHHTVVETGMRLERYIVSQEEKFAVTDQELASMIRIHQFAPIAYTTALQSRSAMQSVVHQQVFTVLLDSVQHMLQRQSHDDYRAVVLQYQQLVTAAAQMTRALTTHGDTYMHSIASALQASGVMGASGSAMFALHSLLSDFVFVQATDSLLYQSHAVTGAVSTTIVPQVTNISHQCVQALYASATLPWHISSPYTDIVETTHVATMQPHAFSYDHAYQQMVDTSSGWHGSETHAAPQVQALWRIASDAYTAQVIDVQKWLMSGVMNIER
jgi:hypothetical protein